MNVLQVGKFYSPETGGIETVLEALCDELSRHTGVAVRVLVANRRRQTVTEDVGGVYVTRVASWGTVASTSICPSFANVMNNIPADLVHLHEPNPLATLSYLRVKPPTPLVVSFHSDIVRQKLLGKLYRPFVERLLDGADRIIVATPNHIACSPILAPFRNKCVVIPFGIDVEKFRHPGRANEIRAQFGPRLVLFIGRLVYYKGVEHLIRAMQWVDGKLLIIGSGRLEKELRKTASRLKLEERIVFLGEQRQEALPSYYHACDVFVLPSTHRSEMFGLVQLEAMACGKPVVSTNLPTGVSWVNQDGRTGLLVPPADARALAGAITRLLDDRTLRERLGANGRRRVETEFTKEKMGARVFKLYREILC